MSQRFTGRVAVVTGAGQSIGFECAAAFAREGAHAVITDVDLDKAKAAAERLQREGLSAIVLPIDVRDPDQMEQAVQAVTGQFGRLDVWVNNAGVAQHYESFDLPRDLWQMSMDVMLSGTFFGCQAAGRGMREHGGAIVNMASVNGFVPQPRRAAYCAAKAGVIMLTRVLASEWAANHIRVNAVAPSPVGASGMAKMIDSVGITSLSQYTERHPMKRLVEMREVVEAVLFLASDAASFVTGETLCVDGGWIAYGS